MSDAPYLSLIKRLGFTEDPFADVDADREGKLESYYVKPPFFAAVYGSPSKPKSCTVFAPRGFGKTALKRMIELQSADTRLLCLSYNRFPNPRVANLQYHLTRINRLFLATMLSHFSEVGVREASTTDRNTMAILASKYFSDLGADDMMQLVDDIKTPARRATEFWNSVLSPANVLLGPVCSMLGVPNVDIRSLEISSPRIGSHDDQFLMLKNIALRSGFVGIYVLVDRLDETDVTGNDPNKTFAFVAPLLTNLGLIEQPGIGFKFFLWDQIEGRNRIDGREDRVPVYRLEWTDEQILTMLHERMRSFSASSRANRFSEICLAIPKFDVDFAIALFSMGSPRNTIRLCKAIVDRQSNINPMVSFLTEEAISTGFQDYARQLSESLTGERDLQELKKIGRIDFTFPYVYNDALKIKQNPAQRKLQKYQNQGIIEIVGRKRYREGSNNLSNHYAHTNVIIAKSIFGEMSITEFMRSKVRRCQQCGNTNLRDWDLDENQTCGNCFRSTARQFQEKDTSPPVHQKSLFEEYNDS